MSGESYVKTVRAKGRAYNYLRAPKGTIAPRRPIRLPDNIEMARAEAQRLVAELTPTEPAPRPRFKRRQAWSTKMEDLARAARVRARAKGRAFALTGTQLVRMIEDQGYRCAVSGIELELNGDDPGTWRRPYSPSLDRIDARGGYTIGNVRIVCAAINVALSDWGEAVFLRVAEAAISVRRERDRNAKLENSFPSGKLYTEGTRATG